jgi:NADH:ubiquinone oxidoreductase subunit F (NADH-binding)
LAQGAAFYKNFGVGRSSGTLPFQLAGNIRYGGLVERAFGLSLRELLFDFGGGSRSGRPIKAVQVGGPLGAYVPESQWDVPLDYEAYAAIGAVVGHGGIVRAKPPLPAIEGLFGQPTVINNVITLASVPLILAKGAAFYKNFGVGRSTGTLPFQLAGNIPQGGLVERAFGLTLR